MNVYPSKRQRFLSRQPFRYLNTKRRHEKRERRCVHDTKYSQAVSHPSTNFAQPGLTAVIGREPVLSWWCGRERLPSKIQRFLSRQPFRYLNTKRRYEKRERRCVHDTKYSQAVSHPSTNFAQPGLTAVIGREPVLSCWCGRERLHFEKTTISIKTTVSLPKHEAEA